MTDHDENWSAPRGYDAVATVPNYGYYAVNPAVNETGTMRTMETGCEERPVLRNETTMNEPPRGVVLRDETTTDEPPRGEKTTTTTCEARTTAAEEGARPEETTEPV
ncbi:hypothetical protein PF008_g4894 [Phytophthora fragariae]|uniref:Uncharacterized protein n=1 Tax=Phytophthora fragariae TaxID=53985 RepID=A0A6G0SBL2_9STRA|nr:hypothetical protein PF008_g4894 [Phytophthora fragariae]